MEIRQEISDFKGTTDIIGVGSVPNITRRDINGEVAVNDGETVILGGIILDRKEGTKTGVPLLMDIPLLGRLFSNSKGSKNRSELVVLMRPTVLKTPELVAKHTIVEKEGMPGIMAAEADLAKREHKLKAPVKSKTKSAPAKSVQQSAPESLFDRPTPFTEEDEKFLLSTPPPNSAH
jgi:type II secretory pathway component GspD/PulD (secretin)